jgi:regulator of protease activity HflC (stomatin/prohibitin superfamily)
MSGILFIAVQPRRRLGLLAALAAITLGALSSVTRVGVAEVGIRVKLAGDSRGVDSAPVVTGWVFYNPLLERVITFPTSVHTTVWTQDAREGSPGDDSITFSSSEGVNINADVAISFHIEPEKAPHLYQRFRKDNLEAIADGYVRNAVREAFNLAASKSPVEHIYGPGKAAFLEEVAKRLQEKLEPEGIAVDQLTLNGGLRLPERVATSINRALEATQLAVQAENKVRQVKAEAEQEVTAAEGQANAARATARGEADARMIQARADAKANLLLRASTSPSVLQYRALEHWDGKLPVLNGKNALAVPALDVAKVGDLGASFDAPEEQKPGTPPRGDAPPK